MLITPGTRCLLQEQLPWAARPSKCSGSRPAFHFMASTFASATCPRKPSRCVLSTSTKDATWGRRSSSAFVRAATYTANLPASWQKARRQSRREKRFYLENPEKTKGKWARSLALQLCAHPKASAQSHLATSAGKWVCRGVRSRWEELGER